MKMRIEFNGMSINAHARLSKYSIERFASKLAKIAYTNDIESFDCFDSNGNQIATCWIYDLESGYRFITDIHYNGINKRVDTMIKEFDGRLYVDYSTILEKGGRR